MFTLSRVIAIAASGVFAGAALTKYRIDRRSEDSWFWTADPVGAEDYDVPPPGHPEALTATAAEFEEAMILREAVFPGRPYIVDLASWLESAA